MKNRSLLLFILSIFSSSMTNAASHPPKQFLNRRHVNTGLTTKKSLRDFNAKGASVLPIVELPINQFGGPFFASVDHLQQKQLLIGIKSNKVKFAILSREVAGKDKGKFDDFGGRTEKYDKHPVQAAAREFVEEANAEKVLGFNQQYMEQYLDPSTKNTELIIAQESAGASDHFQGGNYVTYITDFHPSFAQKLANWFALASANATDKKYQEKDMIVLVRYDDLLKHIKNRKMTMLGYLLTIIPTEGQEETTCPAQTGDLVKIDLRPSLGHKLRNFSKGMPFVEGKSKKIRFYQSPLLQKK